MTGLTGRSRKFGLAGMVIAGSLLFGVGFAGAEAPVVRKAPKVAHSVSAPTGSTDTVSSKGGDGCGGEYDTASVNPADF